MPRPVLIGLILVGIIAAGTILAVTLTGALGPHEKEQVIQFHTLLWGVNNMGPPEQTYLVINNQSTLTQVWTRAFWDKGCPTPYPPSNCPPVPNITFANTTVIVVFRGRVGFGDMTINVTKVSVSGPNLFVRVQLTDPDWNRCNAVIWSVYPFHIVAITKTEAHAKFTTVTAKRCG